MSMQIFHMKLSQMLSFQVNQKAKSEFLNVFILCIVQNQTTLMAISDWKTRILALNAGSYVCRRYFMASPSSWAKQTYRMLVVQPQASEEIWKRKYKITHKKTAKYFKLQNTPFFPVPVVSGAEFLFQTWPKSHNASTRQESAHVL